MTGKNWRIVLGSTAEKDFVRILTYTTETFGPRRAEIYEATILDALAAGPDTLGSLARND